MRLTKRETNLLKVLGVIALLGAGSLYIIYNQPDPIRSVQDVERPRRTNSNTTSSPRSSAPTSPRGGGGGGSVQGSQAPSNQGPGSVSITAFEQNNTLNSCWVLIDGEVYDISEYLRGLPNADDPASYCGTFGFEEGYIGNSTALKEQIIEESTLKGTIG
jgi:hypothetical protein